jgi:hypothetical protein
MSDAPPRYGSALYRIDFAAWNEYISCENVVVRDNMVLFLGVGDVVLYLLPASSFRSIILVEYNGTAVTAFVPNDKVRVPTTS